MNKALTILPQAALSLVSIPLTLSAQDAAEKQPQRPNIVYIMTDDHPGRRYRESESDNQYYGLLWRYSL